MYTSLPSCRSPLSFPEVSMGWERGGGGGGGGCGWWEGEEGRKYDEKREEGG